MSHFLVMCMFHTRYFFWSSWRTMLWCITANNRYGVCVLVNSLARLVQAFTCRTGCRSMVSSCLLTLKWCLSLRVNQPSGILTASTRIWIYPEICSTITHVGRTVVCLPAVSPASCPLITVHSLTQTNMAGFTVGSGNKQSPVLTCWLARWLIMVR